MSWAGLGLIGASAFLVTGGSVGFPAPWALLPAAGAALVIAAGVGGEPRFQGFLRNRASTYLGNISYSLYLVHWPVIVIIGSLMTHGVYFYACVLAVSSGLAVGLYHLIEIPLRNVSFEKIRDTRRAITEGVYTIERSTKAGLVLALVLLTVGLIAYAARPDAYELPSSTTVEEHIPPPRV